MAFLVVLMTFWRTSIRQQNAMFSKSLWLRLRRVRSDPATDHQPAVMVSKEDGRVIAMQAPDVQPVTPVAETPQKQGLHPLASFALKVLGRVAVGVVMGQINHPHHKK